MERAYNCLADYFEYLNEDCDYKIWSQYLISKLSSFDGLETGVDIGCGGGYFTRKLERAGYSMLGVDCNEAMLSNAIQNSKKEGLRSNYILQKVQSLKLNKKVDFAVSVNDCFNYIKSESLASSFKKVYNNLKGNGVFLFDISSEYKFKNIIANNTFGEDTDKVSYLWFNTLSNDFVDMDITLFIKEKDGRYIKREESHRQYIHSEERVTSALKEAGFEIVCVEGHLGQEKSNNAERLNFICKRT